MTVDAPRAPSSTSSEREAFAFARVPAADDMPTSAKRLPTAVYAAILVATVLAFLLSGR